MWYFLFCFCFALAYLTLSCVILIILSMRVWLCAFVFDALSIFDGSIYAERVASLRTRAGAFGVSQYIPYAENKENPEAGEAAHQLDLRSRCWMMQNAEVW